MQALEEVRGFDADPDVETAVRGIGMGVVSAGVGGDCWGARGGAGLVGVGARLGGVGGVVVVGGRGGGGGGTMGGVVGMGGVGGIGTVRGVRLSCGSGAVAGHGGMVLTDK